ncbi:MAG: hypothetical protein HOP37_09435 [Cyclobacteriaceae bacterium]|nr:hypothetical protein [Cyclobacteriaceae bacterium]
MRSGTSSLMIARLISNAGKMHNANLKAVSKRIKQPKWTPAEDQFIKDNLGYLTDEEIGKKLGRTAVGVHVHWSRDLHLKGPSKAPGILTAHDIAKILQVDAHKIAHWVDVGFIKGRLMAGGRKIRLIKEKDFYKWALQTNNWIYFDPSKVGDSELAHLINIRAKLWGDEWWSTPKVAKYHRVNTKDVTRLIADGRIRAVQPKWSLGGRHPNQAWKYWFVKKSEATKPSLKFYHRKGVPGHSRIFTDSAIAWIVKAIDEKGMNFTEVARSMKLKDKQAGSVRNWYCRTKGIDLSTKFKYRGKRRKKVTK